ncbi:hypothetical protein XA67_24320 [Comamonas thiooxydans]|uniref:hypothetical protein n=1 Tax=Comamonas thiooxydans TaxID=363952 RepID=UPI0006214FCF|nr:hypothetical protein [Comamonas thiooxydans]KKI11545.1 hypothetical protein XA67_24320 [Comamonas thiooxydans]
MLQAQLDFIVPQLFWAAVGGGILGACLVNCVLLLVEGLASVVAAFFARRNRIENARKRAALFSRLAVKSQAEYDRLLVELATGKAEAAGGVVGRACETHDAASAGARAVALPLTAREV